MVVSVLRAIRGWAAGSAVALAPGGVVVALMSPLDKRASVGIMLWVVGPFTALVMVVGALALAIGLPVVASRWKPQRAAIPFAREAGVLRSRALVVSGLWVSVAALLYMLGLVGVAGGPPAWMLRAEGNAATAIVYVTLFLAWLAPEVQETQQRGIEAGAPLGRLVRSVRVVVVAIPAICLGVAGLFAALVFGILP